MKRLGKTFRYLVGVLLLSIVSGCIFAPRNYGYRGLSVPGDSYYTLYLSSCRKVSKQLDSFCTKHGEPVVIKIGSSGGIFVWREPLVMISVRSFGRTSLRTPVAKEFLPFVQPAVRMVPLPEFSTSAKDTDVPHKKESVQAPQYRLLDLSRESQDDFVYSFRLEFKDSADVNVLATQRVKRELRAAIEEDFREAIGEKKGDTLQIDFPEFALRNGVVQGRAEVIRLNVLSLHYDVRTQKGRISVKIGASRFDQARQWIRQNIETIVRDKNIALVTGNVPQNKRFYLGTERVLEGNVLEIEFEVE